MLWSNFTFADFSCIAPIYGCYGFVPV